METRGDRRLKKVNKPEAASIDPSSVGEAQACEA